MEILLDNRNGKVWDISEIVTDATWKTGRNGSPSEFDFTLIKNGLNQDQAFKIENGNIVRFKYQGHHVFYGFIFSVNGGKSEDIQVKAYDQIRYLQAADTYVFSNITASQVIRRIAGDFGLNLGQIDDTGYRIPSLVGDAEKLLDIICKALDLTLINANRHYIMFDNFGALTVRNTADMILPFMIGDESLLYDYSFERSINDETYNRIKLVRDNKDTGKRDVYISQDSANIAKWGQLQLYEKLDENQNPAQIKELLNTLMTLRNKETEKIKLEAIGDIRVRAGCYLPVIIKDYGINQPFLIDDCTHSFNGREHTMSLELKVVWKK
ncbi:XkdQ/YqbQ family protein [Amphibacillus sediminis]|uniref:XkdQ/YqbQ family protein n=1 Tax=Amphibacillus sediminis TaxID=360185 RepID=UPI00082D4B25|nr:hypothetical protein [Amphibacillus sediminis]